MATPQQLRQERERKCSQYPVRTRFIDEHGEPRYINHLIQEDSPYLLQHAHNPVDWYPWGDEAFAKAAREDKPVFLSIGYSTCHWCHVMEEESFDDEDVADVLNRHFVAIKVDREQRPDLDDIYMTAVQLVSGGGGWPMSTFLTPEGQPFFGGTYFPKPQFIRLLTQVSKVWNENRQGLIQDAERLDAGIRQQLAPAAAEQLDASLPDTLTDYLIRNADTHYGGFGGAPKFPHEANLFLLLEQIQRDPRPLAEQPAWAVLRHALDAMLQGGIYDQVGGGFHRYATDRKWLVPHFEKMLYNQGQLASVYLWAWQLSGHAEYRRITEETLDYLLREMRAPDGGFYSATDADSEGVEGRFFVWRYDELTSLLGQHDLTLCQHLYGVTRSGNFEGSNVLYLPQPLDRAADNLGIPRERLDKDLNRLKQQLYDVRAKRVPPLRDDKQITEWNGMVIAALAQAALALERPDYLEAARAAAEHLWQHHRDTAQGRLWRTSLHGVASVPAQLEDYAHFLNALLALFDASDDPVWLERARTLLDELHTRHWDHEAGGYFVAPAHTVGPQLVRSKNLMDGATVCGNSLMLPVLIALYQRSGDLRLRPLIDQHIQAFSGRIQQIPQAGPVFLLGLLQWQSPTPAPLQYLAGGAIRIQCRAEPIAPGRLRIHLALQLRAGWHVQGYADDDQNPVATRVGIENPEDWQEEQLQYSSSVAAEATTLAGTVTITLEAKAHTQNPLRLSLQLQPCTGQECLPLEHCAFIVQQPV